MEVGAITNARSIAIAAVGNGADDAARIAAANADPRPWPMQWIDDGIATQQERLTQTSGKAFFKREHQLELHEPVRLRQLTDTHLQRLEAANIETAEMPEAYRGHLVLIKGDEQRAADAAQVLSATDNHARPTAVVLEDMAAAADADRFYVALPGTANRYTVSPRYHTMSPLARYSDHSWALDTRRPILPGASSYLEKNHPGLVGVETGGRYSKAIRSTGMQVIVTPG